MKTLRTVVLILAVLVSIFFVVFANIQTELAKEAEAEANALKQESVALAEKCKETEARFLLAQNEAEDCRELLNATKKGAQIISLKEEKDSLARRARQLKSENKALKKELEAYKNDNP